MRDASALCASATWIVGDFDRSKKVTLSTYESENQAREAYDEYPQASRVLWLRKTRPEEKKPASAPPRSKTLKACSTAYWDVQGHGVATLLNGDEAAATPDDIQRKLDQGLLPFVPPQRPLYTQSMLKLAMKLTFGRTAVTHFGSAPYRYQSVCHFDMPPGERQKYVALSLDDAPCRFDDRDCSMIPRIKELLAKSNGSKATFIRRRNGYG